MKDHIQGERVEKQNHIMRRICDVKEPYFSEDKRKVLAVNGEK